MLPDALSALKDIHLPEKIGFWPMATSVWIILCLLCFMLIGGIYWYLKLKHRNYVKKQALIKLKHMKHDWQKSNQSAFCFNQLNVLLKTVAIHYDGREVVAQLSDDMWIKYLSTRSKNLSFEPFYQELTIYPYAPNVQLKNVDALLNVAQDWIKQRGRIC